MTISERIFERLRQLSMTQREFADNSQTGHWYRVLRTICEHLFQGLDKVKIHVLQAWIQALMLEKMDCEQILLFDRAV